MNKTIEQVLQTLAAEVDSKWVWKLSFIEFAINSSVNVSTAKSAFELIYGQEVHNIVDKLDSLHRVEGAQQCISNITKLISEAKYKLVEAWQQ